MAPWARGCLLAASSLLAAAAAACSSEPRREDPAASVASPWLDTDAVSVWLPSDAADPLWIEDKASRLALGVCLQGASSRDVSDAEGERRFASAYDGHDLLIRRTPFGVEDWVTSTTSDAALSYELELSSNVAGLRSVAGVVEALDAHGTPRLRGGPAVAWGADGQRVRADVAVHGCKVDTDPRAPWGRAPVEPGAHRCVVTFSFNGLVAPARIDPPWQTTVGNMAFHRRLHQLTLMDNGLVLASGGRDDENTSELFDPQTETWSTTGLLNQDRAYHTATKLSDGRVLVTGALLGSSTATAETYDPTTGQWTATGLMNEQRGGHTATLLGDDRVLVTGGHVSAQVSASSVDLFDPTTDTFTPGPSLSVGRRFHTATRLDDMRVLVVGGLQGGTGFQASTEFFDATTDTWAPGPNLNIARYDHRAVKTASGALVVAAGRNTGPLATAETLDAGQIGWSLSGTMSTTRGDHVAELLSGELFLVAGGVQASGLNTATADLGENGAFTPTDDMSVSRRNPASVRLSEGVVMVSGGSGSVAHTSSEIYRLIPNGEPCSVAESCESGICHDGICCDTVCDGVCMSCLSSQTLGTNGICAPVAGGTDPEDECFDSGSPTCLTNGFCNGAGDCDTYPETPCQAMPCTDGDECASGFCDVDDGICCDVACDQPCQTCTAAKKGGGVDGECGLVQAKTSPDSDCGPTDGGCSTISYCDEQGACVPAETLCAPYVCAGELGCSDVCTTSSQCVAGFECVDGACTPIPEPLPPCADDVTANTEAGPVDCTPYLCQPSLEGACPDACSSIDDCADPNVCSDAGRCVAPPAVRDESASCSLGRPVGGNHGWVILLAVLFYRRRQSFKRHATDGAKPTVHGLSSDSSS